MTPTRDSEIARLRAALEAVAALCSDRKAIVMRGVMAFTDVERRVKDALLICPKATDFNPDAETRELVLTLAAEQGNIAGAPSNAWEWRKTPAGNFAWYHLSSEGVTTREEDEEGVRWLASLDGKPTTAPYVVRYARRGMISLEEAWRNRIRMEEKSRGRG